MAISCYLCTGWVYGANGNRDCRIATEKNRRPAQGARSGCFCSQQRQESSPYPKLEAKAVMTQLFRGPLLGHRRGAQVPCACLKSQLIAPLGRAIVRSEQRRPIVQIRDAY